MTVVGCQRLDPPGPPQPSGAVSVWRSALLSGGTGTGQTTWGGPANDRGTAIARDAAGNLYALGTTASFGAGGTDLLVTKLGPSGIEWARTWGGAADDFGTSIAVGPDGNLYVIGATSSFGVGWFDLVVMKLDTAGTLVWAKAWGAASYDTAYDVTFDAAGNVLVAGQTYDCSADCHGSAIILKLDTAGGEIWSKAYKGPATYDVANTLTVDVDGNIVVAGTSWDYHSDPHNSILVMKTDGAGNLLWHRDWSSPRPGQDEVSLFRAVTTDAVGNIYVGGRHSQICTVAMLPCDFDALVLKISASGDLQWTRFQPSVGWDTAGALSLDKKGRLFVSGIRDGFGLPSIFLDQYDTAGSVVSGTRWATGATPSQATNEVGMLLSGDHALIVSAAPGAAGQWTTGSVLPSGLGYQLTAPTFATNPPGLTTSVLATATVLQGGGVVDQGGGASDLFLAALPLPTVTDVNIAFNPTCSGFPSPLESDQGWGGGAQPCQIVDGLHQYNTWASGLAFTGGHFNGQGGGPWVEPAGVRHAVIDFGTVMKFHKVTMWWHGVEYTPDIASLELWDGVSWVPIPDVVRVYGAVYEEGTNSGYSHSDEYTFAPVSASKVRYTFDNSGHNIIGTWNIHGWLYEMEVWSAAADAPDGGAGGGGLLPLGAPCNSGPACQSGSCADGVCCGDACGGDNPNDCQACSVAAGAPANGTCAPLPATKVCYTRTHLCDSADEALTCTGTSGTCPTPTPRSPLSCTSLPTGQPPGATVDLLGGTNAIGGLTLTFEGGLVSSGDIAVGTCSAGALPPTGFKILQSSTGLFCWNIDTSPDCSVTPAGCPYAPPIEVCIHYDASAATNEDSLLLYHDDGSGYLPATTSLCKSNGCVANRMCPTCCQPCPHPARICGTADSLSPFAIMQPLDANPPVFTNVPGTIVAFAPSTQGAKVSYVPPKATDAVDGTRPVTCTRSSGTTFPVGKTIVTCSAADKSGNGNQATFTVWVQYQAPADGTFFLSPIRANGSSIFRIGKALPVKFKLTGASAGITNLAATLIVTKISNAVQGTVEDAGDEDGEDTDFIFKFRPGKGLYGYRWKTRGQTQGTYQLRADLGDGVVHQINVSLKAPR